MIVVIEEYFLFLPFYKTFKLKVSNFAYVPRFKMFNRSKVQMVGSGCYRTCVFQNMFNVSKINVIFINIEWLLALVFKKSKISVFNGFFYIKIYLTDDFTQVN